MSARTNSSPSSSCPASSSSSSTRRERLPNESALEVREFDGARYVMERGLFADVALVHAWKGDREGNLVYRKTARNFNPMMATAGRITVAEVEHLVEPGAIEPDHIHTPGIFVERIVPLTSVEKRIEQRTVRRRGE